MHNLSSYSRTGLALLLAGGIAAPVFFLVAGSVSLTALALSVVLLGFISLLLARSLPAIPPQAARLLLDAGLDNLAGLIEELGVDAGAVYLPSSMTGGKPRALIPLHSDPARSEIRSSLPQRMIVSFGPNPEDMGILVTTPGTAIMPLLDSTSGPTSSELESAMTRVLVGALDLAASVRVAQQPGIVTVDVAGLQFETDDLAIYRVLGTPIASIAAAVTAEGLGRPVTIRSEDRAGGRLTVQIEETR